MDGDKYMFSNKPLLIISVISITVTAYIFYSYAQIKTPPKRTTCEILISDLLEVKTQAERDFVLERWRLLCDKDKP